MKAIIISFTLKGQDWQKIANALLDLSKAVGTPVILIHGFMPVNVLRAKGFPTTVTDILTRLFPIQLNLYTDAPLRYVMAEIGRKLAATVYIIGEIREGVIEEENLYRDTGLLIKHIPINTHWTND